MGNMVAASGIFFSTIGRLQAFHGISAYKFLINAAINLRIALI